MMKTKSALIFLLLFQLMITNLVNGSPPEEVRAFAFSSLRWAIIQSLHKTLYVDPKEACTSPDGLILLLGEIDSDETREFLLQLTDVYIGEATYSALRYSILKHGKKIRAGLKEHLKKPASCSFSKGHPILRNIKLRCITKEQRDRIINDLLDQINKGIIVEYDM